MRPDSIACFSVRTTCSCPTTSSNVIGRYFSGSATCCRPSSARPFFAMESNSALNKQHAAQEPPRAAAVVAAAALRQAQAEPRQVRVPQLAQAAPQQAPVSPPQGHSTDTHRHRTRRLHTNHSDNVDAAQDLAANRAYSAAAHRDGMRDGAAEPLAAPDHATHRRHGVSDASSRHRHGAEPTSHGRRPSAAPLWRAPPLSAGNGWGNA